MYTEHICMGLTGVRVLGGWGGGRDCGRLWAAAGGGHILYLHSNFRRYDDFFSCYFLCAFIFQFYADTRKRERRKVKI